VRLVVAGSLMPDSVCEQEFDHVNIEIHNSGCITAPSRYPVGSGLSTMESLTRQLLLANALSILMMPVDKEELHVIVAVL